MMTVGSAAAVLRVGTPDEFVAAIADGARDIIVTKHLDLTQISLPLK
jgi:hypothetical protein